MPHLTPEQIVSIPSLLQQGYNEAAIARKFKCARSTISRRVRSNPKPPRSKGKVRVGRPPKLSPTQKKKALKAIKHYKHLGSRRLAPKISNMLQINVTDREIRKLCQDARLKFDFPVKKPLLTALHKVKRRQFAKKHKKTNFDTYIFTDEKTFSLGGGKVKERYVEGYRPIAPTTKHPKKLHVWWGVSKSYYIKPYCFTTNLDAKLYRKILSTRLPTSHPDGWVLQQDNDPKHKAHETVVWLNNNTPAWTDDWPSQSPDINPMENIWAILVSKVYTKPPKSIAALERKIKKCCAEFDDDIIANMVDSVPKRLKLVLKSKGEATKY